MLKNFVWTVDNFWRNKIRIFCCFEEKTFIASTIFYGGGLYYILVYYFQMCAYLDEVEGSNKKILLDLSR